MEVVVGGGGGGGLLEHLNACAWLCVTVLMGFAPLLVLAGVTESSMFAAGIKVDLLSLFRRAGRQECWL